MPDDPIEFRLEPRRVILTVLVVCVGVELALMLADYWINYRELADVGAIRRLFNNTREDSLAGFFAVSQTLLVALTLWVVWLVARRQAAGASGFAALRRHGGWLILALFFSYMTIDDGAMVHERMGTAFEAYTEASEDSLLASPSLAETFPSYAWQILFVPVFGSLGLFTLWFLWQALPRRRDRWIVVVALAALSTAVVLDFFEGLEDDHRWNIYAIAAERWELDEYTLEVFYAEGLETLQHFSRSVEETLEMFANTLLWVVFLGYLFQQTHEIRLSWRAGGLKGRGDP